MSDASEYQISMAGGDGDPLDAIQARAEAAYPGPWTAWDRGIGYEVHTHHEEPLNYHHRETFGKADAEFIAHARTDVPALLALVRKQAAALKAVDELTREWEAVGKGATQFDSALRVCAYKTRAAIAAALEPAQ